MPNSQARLVSRSAARSRRRCGEAARLVKFDLSTQMVVELPSLAGVMAREYALRAGAPEPVAQALYEAELPRHVADAVPASRVGALLALADRFDLVAGLFAVGAEPTGSSDPFGVRRAALGLVAVLRAHPGLREVTLGAGLEAAARVQPVAMSEAVRQDAARFVVGRYERQLLDAGHDPRLVQAALPMAEAPAVADETLAELARHTDDPAFAALVEAMQRVTRIVPADVPPEYDPAALTEAAEWGLHEAVLKLRSELGGGPVALARFVPAAMPLVDPVSRFFTDVLVMTPDSTVRATRLGLLAALRQLAAGVVDWGRL